MSKATVYYSPITAGESLDSMAAKAARLAARAGMEKVVQAGQPCAVKTHFGEGANKGYVKPPIVAAIVAGIAKAGASAFITDTNTLYRGRRSNALDHIRQAADHGFTLESVGAPILIADGLLGADQVAVPIEGGKHFKEIRIAAALHQAPSSVVLTHVKGHLQMGLGGAIKNVGMGCAARAGKLAQHQGGAPVFLHEKCIACGTCVRWCPTDAIKLERPPKAASPELKATLIPERCIGCGECLALCPVDAVGFEWSQGGPSLIERICEHALGFVRGKEPGRVLYLNFVNHLTKNCDCFDSAQEAEFPDVGIFCSTDIVAVDKATADVSRERLGRDIWAAWWPESQYETMFRYGAKLGLGVAEYDLITVA